MYWVCILLIAIALLASYWAWRVSDEIESILIGIPATICLIGGIIIAPISIKLTILTIVLLVHRIGQPNFHRSTK
ncbi:MAG: hypothetical protein ACTS2F_30375 [Thainema sp.]